MSVTVSLWLSLLSMLSSTISLFDGITNLQLFNIYWTDQIFLVNFSEIFLRVEIEEPNQTGFGSVGVRDNIISKLI